jgi:hypothetical protein
MGHFFMQDIGSVAVPAGPFATALWSGTGAAQSINIGFQPDLVIVKSRSDAVSWRFVDSARGATVQWQNPGSSAESTDLQGVTSFGATGFGLGTSVNYNSASNTYLSYCFAKLAGFFDIATYTGTGVSGRTVAHALGVAPELIIVRGRSTTSSSAVAYPGPLSSPATKFLTVSSNAAVSAAASVWNNTAPTSSVFSVGNSALVNQNTSTYVAYMFASQAGQSKVGSYTGNGSASGPSVACGFQPSFVMIKRTDTTGDWFMFDSVRDASPINTNSLLDSTAVEATAAYDVTTGATGFQLTNAATSALNVSAGIYVFLAIK